MHMYIRRAFIDHSLKEESQACSMEPFSDTPPISQITGAQGVPLGLQVPWNIAEGEGQKAKSKT